MTGHTLYDDLADSPSALETPPTGEKETFFTERSALLPETDESINSQGTDHSNLAVTIGDHEDKEHHHHHHHTTYREVFLATLPVFAGYACLFALQGKVKVLYDIQVGSERERVFSVAVSFLYLGNFIFRLGHNIIFGFLAPRNRVLVSMGAMFIAMITLGLVMVFNPYSLAWVFIAYGLGGVGIGTFEANMLSVVTPLGSNTKLWCVIGIPVGVLLITIGAFLLMQVHVTPLEIYFVVAGFILVGVVAYMARIYRLAANGFAPLLKDFIAELRQFRQWMPQITFHSLAMILDMLCVSAFSPGLVLYLYNTPTIKFFGRAVPQNYYFVIYNSFFSFGDTVGRKIFYKMRPIFPFLFLILSGAGVGIGLSTVTDIVPLCGLLVALANGGLYAQTCHHIDKKIDKRFNLIALSFWLFVGDIGSVVGSNLIP